MLIEQIIEFELRGLSTLERTCTPTTGYFYVKTKISKQHLRLDYYLLLKYLQKFNPKMQNYKRIFDQIISKRKIKTISFFNQLSYVKKLVRSNGSEHMRNVIQWH